MSVGGEQEKQQFPHTSRLIGFGAKDKLAWK